MIRLRGRARAAKNPEGMRVAGERSQALAPKLSKITVVPPPGVEPELEIRRDGVVVGRAQWGVPIPVDPGKHSISAVAPGYAPWQTEVDSSEPGGTLEVPIPELVAVAAAPSGAEGSTASFAAIEQRASSGGLGTQRYVAIGAGVLGVAGVVVGSVFGLESKAKRDEADERCNGADCRDQKGVTLREQAISAGNISTIAFIGGGVGLACGAVLWITGAKPMSRRQLSA